MALMEWTWQNIDTSNEYALRLLNHKSGGLLRSPYL